jgi:hypothetical protein
VKGARHVFTEWEATGETITAETRAGIYAASGGNGTLQADALERLGGNKNKKHFKISSA